MAGKKHLYFGLFTVISLIIISIFMIMQKKGHKEIINSDNLDSIAKVDHLIMSEIISFTYNLEEAKDLGNYTTVNSVKFNSGLKACELSDNTEYSTTIVKDVSSLPEFKKIKDVNFSVACFSETIINNALVVLSIEDSSGKSLDWQSSELKFVAGNWIVVDFNFKIKSEYLVENNKIKLYVWNKGKEHFFIDDMYLNFEGLVSNKFSRNSYIPERNIEYDFENVFEGESPENYTTSNAFSGKQSFQLNSQTRYSPSVSKKVSEVIDTELKLITISCLLNQSKDDNEVLLVASIKNNKGDEFFWQGRSTEKGMFPKDKWVKHRAQFKLPYEKISHDDVISVYAWNKGGGEVLVDDILIVYGETNVRSGSAPQIDMTLIGDSGYNFAENASVLKMKYLKKHKFDGSDSLATFNNSSLKNSTWSPADLFLTGNFVKSSNGSDQIVRLNKNTIDMLGYCSKSNKLLTLGQVELKRLNIKPDVISLCNNFKGNDVDEILLIDVKQKSVYMIEFNLLGSTCDTGSLSSSNVTETSIDFNWEQILPDGKLIFSTYQTPGSPIQKVLCVNPVSGTYSVLKFDNGKCDILVSKRKSASFQLPADTKNPIMTSINLCNGLPERILLNYYSKGKSETKIVVFSDSGMENPLVSNVNGSALNETSQLFTFGNENCSNRQLLSVNSSWKFSMNLLNFSPISVSKKSLLEFSGFEIGFNPKFYEMNKILKMKINSSTDGIIVISGNCNDSNFDGRNCSQFDISSKWFARIQYFYLNEM